MHNLFKRGIICTATPRKQASKQAIDIPKQKVPALGKFTKFSALAALLVLSGWQANAQAEDAATPQPTPSLTKTSTLFKIKISSYVKDVAPVFYRHGDAEKKKRYAPKGMVFDVLGKTNDQYTVIPVDYTGDIIEIKRQTLNENDCGDYVCINKAYTAVVNDIDQGYGLIKNNLVSGVLVVPFKFYPDKNIISTNNLTVAAFTGFEFDNVFGKNYGLVQKYTVIAALGPSSVQVDSGTQKTNVFAIAAALGLAYDINQQVKFILVAGKDWTGNISTPYEYNSLPWLSTTLGYSF